MCEPATIMGVGSLVIGGLSAVQQYQQASATNKAIAAQDQARADEIAKAAGNELTERARAARRERGAMRAAASEMGVNLAGGSFLAALQTSILNQYNDMGLIVQNERGQQRARAAQAATLRAQNPIPNHLVSALQVGFGAYGAYQRGKSSEKKGSDKAVGKST